MQGDWLTILESKASQAKNIYDLIIERVYKVFAHDTAAMLVFQFKRILIRLFCLEYQHGRHSFC
jgi:hypothetical protein